MSKLTPEDIAWLERRISSAVRPISPPPAFVQNTRDAVLSAARAPQPAARGFVWTPVTYLAVIAAVLALAAAIVRRVNLVRARRAAVDRLPGDALMR